MKKVIKSIFILLVISALCFSAVSMTANAAMHFTDREVYSDSTSVGDSMVYLTQKWLNQQYGDVEGFGSVTENGKTGWDTIYGLLRALQHELGIKALADSFGPTTTSLYQQNPLQRQDGVTDRKFAILQGALWCKGYNPGYNLYEKQDGTVVFEGVFDEKVEQAVIELKKDAGFVDPDGVVTVNVMKALMSMDSFKLLSSYGGTVAVREMQRELNRKYEAYTGLNPCDGIYARNTNKALIYALQAEEGLPVGTANGNFGVTTRLCCPEIPYAKTEGAATSYPGTSESSYYTDAQISEFTKLLQFALTVNGFDVGDADGEFNSKTQQALRDFQTKHALAVTGTADKSTWMSLLVSSGDTTRPATAADCATILTAEKAKTLYDNGYRYIGRYLTGTYNGTESKAITRQEAQIIFDAGLNFFPIYQTSARSASYFTQTQGTEDAKAAIEAAYALGIPEDTIIYFAVDFDATDSQITSNVLPYFKEVSKIIGTSIYRTGIYGTRNVCIRAGNSGYTCSSFVSDMSSGFSGNLGFGLPDDWAFDQFLTISLGSGEGYIEIDKNAFSGRDHGVSQLNEPVHYHTYTSGISKSATCTEPGIKTFTCSCGDNYTEEIPVTGHKLTDLPAKAATCTATGLTAGNKCLVCGTVTVKQNTVAKKAHTYKATTAKATLSKDGKTTNKCSVCGHSTTTTVYKPTSIKLSKTTYTYTGKVITPTVTVKDSKGNTLKKDTDYTVSYSSGRKSTGKYTVTVTFKGKYSGTKKLTFNILPKATSKVTATQTTTSVKAKWSKVTGASGYKVELLNSKGKVVKTVTTTKLEYNFTKLSKGTTYKVKVTAYKTIDSKKVYSTASKTLTTATKPATVTLSKVTAGSKKATLTWKTVTGATGYEIVYSTSKDFKKSKKTATVKKQSTKKTTIKKLTKGKNYYFKVRAYKTVDGKKIYSAYSSVKSVKVK